MTWELFVTEDGTGYWIWRKRAGKLELLMPNGDWQGAVKGQSFSPSVEKDDRWARSQSRISLMKTEAKV
jgi:hypothetical protein